ncbi:MAG: DNA polymerase III subunit beta [Patescibacteria group bacterium]
MRIECVREKFAAAVQKAERVTGKNLTLPVLKCLYLKAERGNLLIRATNLDLGIEINLPVKVEIPGSVAIPGAVLSSFLQQVRNDKNIILETIDGNLSVSTQNNSTLIKALPHDDFPTVPVFMKENSLTLAPKEFVRGLKAVWYASGTSQVKPELSSVYVFADQDELVFVATDSFRLAEKRVRVKKAQDFSHVLIPFKNVTEIMRILEEIDEDVEISFDKNQIAFSSSNVYLTSRLIDGSFPDYKQIIPKEHKTEATLLKEDLVNSLKMAHIFSDKFNQVSLSVTPSKKAFEMKTKNAEVGENVNKLKANLTGEDIDMNFNHKYVTDCFQSIDSDSITLHFNGPSRPVVLRGVSDKTFLYLVMPMNR